ncbi:hypothetical protein D3C78_1392190 [compost metagenome]
MRIFGFLYIDNSLIPARLKAINFSGVSFSSFFKITSPCLNILPLGITPCIAGMEPVIFLASVSERSNLSSCSAMTASKDSGNFV